MRYGVPYQGSKNKICKWVIDNLPSGNVLVDLFAGGCSVTHAGLLSGKWDYFIAFDYDQFERWLDAVPFMVIVSEYTAPAGCVEIASIKKQCLKSPTNTGGTTTEKLFVQERFLKQYNEMREQQRIEI